MTTFAARQAAWIREAHVEVVERKASAETRAELDAREKAERRRAYQQAYWARLRAQPADLEKRELVAAVVWREQCEADLARFFVARRERQRVAQVNKLGVRHGR